MSNLFKAIENSREVSDHMIMGTLTEITDDHDNGYVIAYACPYKRTKRGLVLVQVLWLSPQCLGRRQYGYRRRGQASSIFYTSEWLKNKKITLFDAIGKEHFCTPYLNHWIHYDPVDAEKLPMLLGMSNALDDFIAHQLAR